MYKLTYNVLTKLNVRSRGDQVVGSRNVELPQRPSRKMKMRTEIKAPLKSFLDAFNGSELHIQNAIPKKCFENVAKHYPVSSSLRLSLRVGRVSGSVDRFGRFLFFQPLFWGI